MQPRLLCLSLIKKKNYFSCSLLNKPVLNICANYKYGLKKKNPQLSYNNLKPTHFNDENHYLFHV